MPAILAFLARFGVQIITWGSIAVSMLKGAKSIALFVYIGFLIGVGLLYRDRLGSAIASWVYPSQVTGGSAWLDALQMLNWVFPVTEFLGWLPIAMTFFLSCMIIRAIKSFIPGLS